MHFSTNSELSVAKQAQAILLETPANIAGKEPEFQIK
jgi:hypothetical protein